MYLKNRLRRTFFWYTSVFTVLVAQTRVFSPPVLAQEYTESQPSTFLPTDSSTYEPVPPRTKDSDDAISAQRLVDFSIAAPSEDAADETPLLDRAADHPAVIDEVFSSQQFPDGVNYSGDGHLNDRVFQMHTLADGYRKAFKNGDKKGRKMAELSDTSIQEMHELYQYGEIKFLEAKREFTERVLKKYPELADDEEGLAAEVDILLAEAVRKDLIKHESHLGRAEANSFKSAAGENLYVIRVVHKATEFSILYSEFSQRIEKKKGFSKWVGRQMHEAQRDTLHVIMDEDNPDRIDSYGRPSTVFSAYYWATLGHAIAKAPSGQDVMFVGGFCTLMETASMACIDGAMSYLHFGPPVILMAYINKLPWGFGLGGLLQRTIQNWIEIKGRNWNTYVSASLAWLKRCTISFLYGATLVGFTGEHGFAALNPTTWEGAVSLSYILCNLMISNLFKDQAQEIISADSAIGLNAGDKKIPFTKVVWKDGRKQWQIATMRTMTGLVRYVDLRLKDVFDNFILSRAAYLSLTVVPLYVNYRIYEHRFQAAQHQYRLDPTDENRVWVGKVKEQRDRLQGRWHTFLRAFTPSGAKENVRSIFASLTKVYKGLFYPDQEHTISGSWAPASRQTSCDMKFSTR